eukprot:922875-Amphidinium_carterae.1
MHLAAAELAAARQIQSNEARDALQRCTATCTRMTLQEKVCRPAPKKVPSASKRFASIASATNGTPTDC